jgi:RNA 2',3'-cyclic 3'-phosphodiesterase
MRLFIGIELPDALKSSAAAAAHRIREHIARDAPGAQIRWVPAGNLHVTIWFLGEVSEPRVEAVLGSMKEPLQTRSFTLRVAGAGAFPQSGAPRAVWLGLVDGREGLLSVHDQLRPRLLPLGFEPEKRPFSPHLTIARVKDIRPSDTAALRQVLRDADDGVGECQVASATIFRSRPTPTGSQYEALSRVLLTVG